MHNLVLGLSKRVGVVRKARGVLEVCNASGVGLVY